MAACSAFPTQRSITVVIAIVVHLASHRARRSAAGCMAVGLNPQGRGDFRRAGQAAVIVAAFVFLRPFRGYRRDYLHRAAGGGHADPRPAHPARHHRRGGDRRRQPVRRQGEGQRRLASACCFSASSTTACSCSASRCPSVYAIKGGGHSLRGGDRRAAPPRDRARLRRCSDALLADRAGSTRASSACRCCATSASSCTAAACSAWSARTAPASRRP